MIEYQKVGMDESAATAVHSVYNKYNQEYADCSLDDIGKPSQHHTTADQAYGGEFEQKPFMVPGGHIGLQHQRLSTEDDEDIEI